MTATLKPRTAGAEDPPAGRPVLTALAGGANTGLRESSPSRALPKAGSLPWVRSWHGDQYKRGALVTVNGRRGWIASAAAGFVNVHLADGDRALVRPGEVTFE